MDIAQILTEIAGEAEQRQGKILNYKELLEHLHPINGFHEYTDGSRYFDDLITATCFVTNEASPLLTILFGNSLTYKLQPYRTKFEDGYLAPPHKHNYVELTYVIEGLYHHRIEGRDETFNKGEICLIGKETPHSEYFY
jgi:mannose-6-phosphate isomerase-like protein (cupin superfamily)